MVSIMSTSYDQLSLELSLRDSKEFAHLQLFHHKFGMTSSTRPQMLGVDLMDFRLKFMQEELDEVRSSYFDNDIAGVADGLVDLTYVAVGTAELMGLPWDDAWNAVQAANMAKVRAVPGKIEGKRVAKYDIVKPVGWMAPDIEKILETRSDYNRLRAIERRLREGI